MFNDPADYEAIGGLSRITTLLPGFRVISMPYLVTMSDLPVDGAYDGLRLFEVVWGETRGEILDIKANYQEAELILNDIFPKDKPIILICGAGGYVSLVRGLLIHMGWDPELIYNAGGMWSYEGSMGIDMTIPGEDLYVATWRADYILINFDQLTPIN
jgi:rhodanese-related sulfurtransferase